MKKFEFKSTKEKVDIAGKIYEIDFSDDAIRKYQKLFNKFHERAVKISNRDTENLTEEKISEIFEEVNNLAKEFIDAILGENEYEDLYKKADKSLINMIDLINFIADIINEKSQNIRDNRLDYYLKKKKEENERIRKQNNNYKNNNYKRKNNYNRQR